jgi:glycosyltransferase involved in cell wall biosynthesis
MTRIGLLADRLDRKERRTGIGAYTEGLIAGIEALAPEGEFVAFSTAGGEAHRNSRSALVERRNLEWPRRATVLSWCLLGLPKVDDVGGRIDLLHILAPTVPVPTNAPLIATIHDLMPMKYPNLFGRRQRLLFAETVRRIGRKAKWLIAASEATRRDIVRVLGFPADRVTVVYHGIPTHFSRATVEAQFAVRAELGIHDARIVLFVGEIAERKNVLLLVEAFAKARSAVPEARLLLVGSPGLGSSDVARAVDRLGVSRSVIQLGHVPQPIAEALIATADALVLPSVDEGFGFPALEAMSVGTAVIASEAGSIPEVVGEAGLLVPVNDAQALCAAIVHLITDDERRVELGRRGQERAAGFSWLDAARRTIEVYGNAIGS